MYTTSTQELLSCHSEILSPTCSGGSWLWGLLDCGFYSMQLLSSNFSTPISSHTKRRHLHLHAYTHSVGERIAHRWLHGLVCYLSLRSNLRTEGFTLIGGLSKQSVTAGKAWRQEADVDPLSLQSGSQGEELWGADLLFLQSRTSPRGCCCLHLWVVFPPQTHLENSLIDTASSVSPR